ncbi:Stress-response A/B barrel domain-containing protein HS1 [Citrus sinensis]|uniref:Stress-response A/B barrel domain-containing protein HS1 n=1 Tax=Citrus sinensis TaxID=2711 RepID=A0ACB8IB13_CITSI|nr:Stress-response A/B barrel domain-containing protein HS1 [Citrus sinensis]
MEEAKGVVKHVLLAKFKEGTAQDQIDQLIKDYANLVNLIEPMKSFQWGKNVSIENLHQGFTHIFESTFESTEGVAEYVAHPAHVEYANFNLFIPFFSRLSGLTNLKHKGLGAPLGLSL